MIISVVDPDDDYLGIEVSAANSRFAGATRIYAGLDDLSALALRVAGFPASPKDERSFEFGSRDNGIAGGFASLRFYCVDGLGHAALEIAFEDDDDLYTPASAKFTFQVHAIDLDRFTGRLRHVESVQSGEARLPAAV